MQINALTIRLTIFKGNISKFFSEKGAALWTKSSPETASGKIILERDPSGA